MIRLTRDLQAGRQPTTAITVQIVSLVLKYIIAVKKIRSGTANRIAVIRNFRFFSAATEFYDHKREIFCFMENR